MMGNATNRGKHMDSIAVDFGRAFCELTTYLAASGMRCTDYATVRGVGYGLIGIAMFAASFVTMTRTHPVGRP
jgi:hypothetical protein